MQPLGDNARGQLAPIAPGERAVIDREGHRQGRRIDRVGRQRLGDLGGADRVGDRRRAEPRDGNDVAGLRLLDRPPVEAAIGEQFGQPRLLDDFAIAGQRFHRHVDAGDPGMNKAGQNAAEIGVVVERRRQHRERRVGIRFRRPHMRDDQLEKRRQIASRAVQLGDGPALAARGEQGREIELRLIGVEQGEQVENLVVDGFGPRVGAIDLVDHDNRLQPAAQGLADDKFGLRQGSLGGVDQHENAIDHAEDALDLAAEIGVARRIDDIDPHRMVLGSPLDRGAFGQDRDAALALQLVRIEGAFGDLLIGAKRAALPQELIDERRLSMIDMRDDRDITDIHSNRFLVSRDSTATTGQQRLRRGGLPRRALSTRLPAARRHG